MRRRDCENKCENVVQNKIASDSVKCQAFEAEVAVSVAVTVAVAAGDTDTEGERVADTRYIIAWLTCCCRCCVSMTALRERRESNQTSTRERGSAPACLCVRESDTNTSKAAIAA